jgi:tetratricopeptide (TPR) repeat protein
MLNHLLLVTALFLTPSALMAPAIEQAQAFFSAGNYDEAIQILLAAHDLAPQEPAIDYWLERSYYEKQNYEQAIAYGEQAVKVAAHNAEYYRWLGRVYGAKAEQAHSFFLARKVKGAFETAVRLDPLNIAAERDFIQYLVEAPWIVGGDKEKAKRQIDYVATVDPLQGQLARAAFYTVERKWKQAELEYSAVMDREPREKEPYMEAADFFEGRSDADNLERAIARASLIGIHDPRIDFYRAVVLVLRRADLHTAEVLLGSYVDKVPERSDYPSHNAALKWLREARNNPGSNEVTRR